MFQIMLGTTDPVTGDTVSVIDAGSEGGGVHATEPTPGILDCDAFR